MSTISEQLQQLNNIKNSFKETINAKGGSITDTTPFSEYPSQVENLSGGGGGSKAIIDVEELPKASWNGTEVPNTGYVENVYINTSLSNEEIIEIVKNLNHDFSNDDYYVFITEDPDTNDWIMIGLTYFEDDDGSGCVIYGITPDRGFSIFDTEEGLHDFNNPIVFNANALDGSAEGFLWGDQNALLSSLFSITPFEKAAPNVDPNYLYRTPDSTMYQLVGAEFKPINEPAIIDVKGPPSTTGKWVGTPLPAHGFIDKVYFNKNLTKEETLAILDSVEFDDSRYSFAKNSQYDVFIWNRYDLGYSWSSGWEFVCLFSGNGRYNLDGWADDCPEYVELKFEADENSEYGKYNEQLSSLVSSTPFEYIEPVTANESVLYRTPDGSLYSYKSNKFVKLITSDDNIGTDPEVLDAIDALEIQIGNINTILDDILGEGE